MGPLKKTTQELATEKATEIEASFLGKQLTV